MAKKPPARGDVVRVTWLDILEDPAGNPDTCKASERVSFGLYWAEEMRGPAKCLITTTTIDKDSTGQQGYCCYPIGCILNIDVVKRMPK